MTVYHRSVSIVSMLLLVLVVSPPGAGASCDTMAGPVVRAARAALDRNNVSPLLVWVAEEQEAEVRQAFEKTMAVRQLNASARELADRYFFETVVRLHRAAEGASFIGLKDDAGNSDILDRGDEALESGVIDHVLKRVTDRVADGIRERFARAMAVQESADRDVAAGRRYVEAYVEFMHYIDTAASPSQGRAPSAPGPSLPRR